MQMFCYVLNSALDPDVRLYAERHCKPHDWVVNRVGAQKLVAGFVDSDKALLFLNLFDAEIDRSYETVKPRRSAVAQDFRDRADDRRPAG